MSRFCTLKPLDREMKLTSSQVTRLPVEHSFDDETIVARALDGEAWAREALYVRHVDRITGIVAKLLRNSADIEDVVQDTFVQGFEDLHQVKTPRHVGRWLAGIAVHRVHRRFRRRKVKQMLGLDRSADDERLLSQAGRDASQEARAELALLDDAFDEMSMAERTCWTLRHLEEYRLQDVATVARCSLATAKRRIASAQAIIDRHFEEVRRD